MTHTSEIYFLTFWRLEVQEQGAGRVGKVFQPGLQTVTFSLCLHMAFPLYMSTPGVSSSSNKDSSPTGLGPHSYDLVYLNYLLRVPSPNTVTLGVELQHTDLVGRGRDTTESIKMTCPKTEKNLNSKHIRP